MGVDGRGATSKAAIKAGSAWATAVECGANDGFRLISSGLGSGGKEVVEDPSLTGDILGNAPDIGQEMHRWSDSMWFRYGARIPELLAFIMGTAAAPTEVEATYEYTHLLSIETRLGDFVSYALRKGGDVAVWEIDSAMLSRLVIEIGGRGPATVEAEFLGAGLTRDNTGTNTLATFAAVTVRAPIAPIYLGDCRLRLNEQEGGALGSGDTIKPDLIRITFDRGLSEEWLADQALGRKISLPFEEGALQVFVQLGFPEYLLDTYQKWVDTKDAKKADLLITSSAAPLTTAASGLFHEYDFDWPHMIGVERPENLVGGPERITDGITFKVVTASANPTGMSSTLPVCTVRNQISTNLLA